MKKQCLKHLINRFKSKNPNNYCQVGRLDLKENHIKSNRFKSNHAPKKQSYQK